MFPRWLWPPKSQSIIITVMMMYHPITISCKKISISVDTVISDYMSPHRDPEPEDSKPIFLHDIKVYDNASPYQVWLQKVQQLRRSRWTFTGILNLSCDLDHNRAIISFHKTIQFTIMCHQIWLQKGSAVQKIY